MPEKLSSGLGWVVAQVGLWILQLSLPFWLSVTWGEPFSGLEGVAALVIGAGGLVLAAASVLALGSNLTPLPKPKDAAVLVVRGPYRVLRHPIYTALVLLFLGWALFWKSPLLLALDLALFVLFVLKSRLEEKWLVQRYPEYVDYRKTTGGLVPRVLKSRE